MERPLFNELFKNSAVKRAGFKGLKRNVDFIQTNTDRGAIWKNRP
jgi:epoxyqueuosine reductase